MIEVIMKNTHLKPALKWPGGKRWLAPQFCKLFPFYKDYRWVEPFCGGLGLTLSLLPEKALLSDINPHLINFYKQVAKGLRIPVERLKNDSETYYRLRDEFNRLIKKGKADTPKAAWLFYYLNRTGYNGLCRFNGDGLFNVPFGRYKNITYQHTFSECFIILIAPAITVFVALMVMACLMFRSVGIKTSPINIHFQSLNKYFNAGNSGIALTKN